MLQGAQAPDSANACSIPGRVCDIKHGGTCSAPCTFHLQAVRFAWPRLCAATCMDTGLHILILHFENRSVGDLHCMPSLAMWTPIFSACVLILQSSLLLTLARYFCSHRTHLVAMYLRTRSIGSPKLCLPILLTHVVCVDRHTQIIYQIGFVLQHPTLLCSTRRDSTALS